MIAKPKQIADLDGFSNVFQIVGQTSGIDREGHAVIYTIGKGIGRRYSAVREVRIDGRPHREGRSDLTLDQAIAAIRAFKARDRGEHA